MQECTRRKMETFRTMSGQALRPVHV